MKQFIATEHKLTLDMVMYRKKLSDSFDFINNQVGDVRVRFLFAGLSGKPGSGLGEPMKVKLSNINLFIPTQRKARWYN